MSRKTCVFTLMVLALVLTIIPVVYAEYPIEDLEFVQNLPENMVAGNTYEMVIFFDNIAKEPVTLIVNITVTSDEPIGYGEIFIDDIELNGIDIMYEEVPPGVFTTVEGIVDANSHNDLSIIIYTAFNLMPGTYNFEIDLMGVEMEPEPGPPRVTGRPNTKPKADAGPNQKAWVGHTVYFNGSKSEDPDGTIESYEWDFGDGTNASGVAVEHEYSAPGQYTVTLTVRDNRWAYDSGTCKVKVSEPPTTVSAEFAERVPGKKKGHVVNAFEEANTTVTLNTTEPVTVTVLRYEDNPHPGDPIPAMALPNYVDVEVSDPDAVIWPIYVEVFYTDEEVEGLDEYSLGIYYWFNGTWQRCSDTGVDTERNVVWAYMTAEEAAGSPILIAGMHAITPPPLPPFLDSLVITPEEIELGDNVTISFDIMNFDSQHITYGVDIYIEDVNVTRIWVDLGGYEFKTVSHTITPAEVGTFNVTVHGMTGSFTVEAPEIPLRPAEFEVTDLIITPEEVEPGDEVTISVLVTNIGEETGDYTVTLDCVDVPAGPYLRVQETVSLEGGESERVEFEVSRNVEGIYDVTVDGLTGSFTVEAPPRPAEFEFSDLRIFYPGVISPEVEEGETVTVAVSIEAENVGELTGSHTLELKVNGSVVDSQEVTLEGGASITTLFELTRGEGTYQVEVEGMTDEFTVFVTEIPPGISPGYVAGIIIVIVSAGVIIYTLRRRQVVTE